MSRHFLGALSLSLQSSFSGASHYFGSVFIAGKVYCSSAPLMIGILVDLGRLVKLQSITIEAWAWRLKIGCPEMNNEPKVLLDVSESALNFGHSPWAIRGIAMRLARENICMRHCTNSGNVISTLHVIVWTAKCTDHNLAYSDLVIMALATAYYP